MTPIELKINKNILDWFLKCIKDNLKFSEHIEHFYVEVELGSSRLTASAHGFLKELFHKSAVLLFSLTCMRDFPLCEKKRNLR